jgi:alcohol dehydrogenase
MSSSSTLAQRRGPDRSAALKNNGRLVTCGATSGFDARTDLRQVFYRHLTLLGSFMGSKAELLEAMKFVRRERFVRLSIACCRSARRAGA